MNNQDFSISILVEQNTREVFDAVTNVRGWWSQNIEGGTTQLNDEFTYRVKDLHRCKMKLVEVDPNKKVVWLVVDNYFNFAKNQDEWIGNKISFEISTVGYKTQVRFTQHGLIPQNECFDICQNAWNGYIHGSLRSLIETGKGQPNKLE